MHITCIYLCLFTMYIVHLFFDNIFSLACIPNWVYINVYYTFVCVYVKIDSLQLILFALSLLRLHSTTTKIASPFSEQNLPVYLLERNEKKELYSTIAT